MLAAWSCRHAAGKALLHVSTAPSSVTQPSPASFTHFLREALGSDQCHVFSARKSAEAAGQTTRVPGQFGGCTPDGKFPTVPSALESIECPPGDPQGHWLVLDSRGHCPWAEGQASESRSSSVGEPQPHCAYLPLGSFLEGWTSPWGARRLKGPPWWRRSSREDVIHCAGGFSP